MEANDQHEIIVAIKNLAIELGHIPKRDEFILQGFSERRIRTLFGTYGALLMAAGLREEKPKRITNEVFHQDLEKHLEKYQPRIIDSSPCIGPYPETLIIGDTHFPFHHQPTLDLILTAIENRKFSLRRVIQIGDLYDNFSHGRFPRSMNVYTPKQEIELAFKAATEMWQKIRAIVKGVECYQVLGNHCVRPMKAILEKYPEAELFMDFSKWFTFEGVKTMVDHRQELLLDGVVFLHGYQTQLGAHRDYLAANAVCGHSHKGGVSYRRINDRTLWELNAGYVGDPESKALSYTATKTTGWTWGYGLIDSLGPRFIPL